MANDDTAAARGGLLPVNFPLGNFKKTLYRVLTSAVAADNIYLGQLMDADVTGRATFALEVTASGGATIGPVVGFLDTNKAAIPSGMLTTTAAPYLPGQTDGYVVVCDDPFQDFVIQEDTGGSALAETNIFNNVNPVYRSSSGNSTTGYSTLELDRSSAGTGTGGLLMIKALGDQMNSDGTRNAAGNYGKWIVQIVRHRWNPFSTGIAGTQL